MILLAGTGIALLLASCKKDTPEAPAAPAPVNTVTDTTGTTDTTNNGNNNTPPPVDTIVYTDIADVYLHSVNAYTQTQWSPCHDPIPSDSSTHYDLDLTGDGQTDVIITCSHHYAGSWQSSGNPCASYYYQVGVSFDTTAADDAVLATSAGGCDSLNYGEPIGPGLLYRPGGAAINLSAPYPGGGYGFSFPRGNDYYVGFRIKRNGITMYGWLLVNTDTYNGVYVKSWALNKTNNLDISAGQTN
jgi:hypothetical protein